MPSERPRLADLPHRFRQTAQELRTNYQQWRSDVRANPALLWESMLVRVAAYIVAGIVLFLIIQLAISGWKSPVLGYGAYDVPPQRATLYVACSRASCGESFITEQAMNFHDWPMPCPKCREKSVYRATLCRTCGAWYSSPPGTAAACPRCAAQTAAEQPASRPKPKKSVGDDAEDPW